MAAKDARRTARVQRAPRLSLPQRMAWREITQHKVRSVLITFLVCLPVLVVTVVATFAQSLIPTPQERVSTELGQTQGYFVDAASMGEPNCIQHPTTIYNCLWKPETSGKKLAKPDLMKVGAEGYQRIPLTREFVELSNQHGGQTYKTHAGSFAGDVSNTVFDERWPLLAGIRPTTGEVAINVDLQRALRLGVGDQLTVKDRAYKVSAIVETVDKSEMLLLPQTVDMTSPDVDARTQMRVEKYVFLAGPAPITWTQIQELNKHGVKVLSRDVLLNPPDVGSANSSMPLEGLAIWGVIGLLLAGTVVLVASAAFAIGVKQQRRQLGLLAATGASAGTLRKVVRWLGIWLGLLGSVIGTLLGLAVTAGIVWWGKTSREVPFPGYHVPWIWLAPIALLGLGSSVLAAVVPARAIAKVDAITAVKTAQAPSKPVRFPIWGTVVLAVGVALALLGFVLPRIYDTGRPAAWVMRVAKLGPMIGLLAMVVGALLCTGGFLKLLSLVIPRWWLSGRLAARDLVRNRSRAVPSVASIMAISALAGAALLGAGTQKATSDYFDMPAIGANEVHVRILSQEPSNATPITTKIAAFEKAIKESYPAATFRQYEFTAVGYMRNPYSDCSRRDYFAREPGCNNAQDGSFGGVLIGDPADFEVLWGRPMSSHENKAWAQGKAVVSVPKSISEEGTFELFTYETGPAPKEPEKKQIPAIAARALTAAYPVAMMSKDAALAHKLTVGLPMLVFDAGATITEEKRAEILSRLSEEDRRSIYFRYERPDQLSAVLWIGVAIIAVFLILIASVTTALAVADNRQDESTLAAIGAPTALRKSTAGAIFWITMFLGVTVGISVGMIAMLGIMDTDFSRPYVFSVPWLPVVVLIGAVPLIGAMVAWAITPGKLRMVRRAE